MAAALNSPLVRRLGRIAPSYYVFAALLLILWIARPNMLNFNVMGIFVRQVAPLGILVLGQLLVMRVKSIDLSSGGVILLVNYCISSGLFPGASLTFSLGLPLAPASWSGLSLAVGASLAESLHPAVRLKWPNDLWLDDRKLGGILIETASFGEGGAGRRQAVIGIGLNIAPRPADGLSTPPAAVRELLPEADAAQILERIVPSLVRDVLGFEQAGFAPFQARFDARDALRDRAVTLSDGTTGTAHGVGEDGSLLVHTAAGLHAVGSSEVSVRPAAR